MIRLVLKHHAHRSFSDLRGVLVRRTQGSLLSSQRLCGQPVQFTPGTVQYMAGELRREIGGFVRRVEAFSRPALPPGRGQQGSAHAGGHGRPVRGLPDPWTGSTFALPARRTIAPCRAPRTRSKPSAPPRRSRPCSSSPPRGSVAPQRRWSRCWSLTTRDRMVSPFQIQIGPFGRFQQR